MLLVYRDAHLQVRFSRLAPMAYRLLTEASGTGRERLQALAGDQEQGLAMLRSLRAQGVVIGTR